MIKTGRIKRGGNVMEKMERLYNLAGRYGWLAIVLLGSIIGGLIAGSVTVQPPGEDIGSNPVVRDFVWMVRKVDSNYVQPVGWERVTGEAITRMLHTLDPHSNFFGQRDFTEMQNEQNSKFYGIGVTLDPRNGRLHVIEVTPGMPAHKVGIRYGDAIVAVDEVSTASWFVSKALKQIRGKEGTAVSITVERAGVEDLQTFQIERHEVPYPSVRNSFIFKPGVGYIRLTGGFNEETTRELREAIANLKAEGMEALLLDLRQNPGGLLKQAIQVAETFLPFGADIVSLRGREGRIARRVYRSENGTPETLPLALLIDGETASSSEIVAAAMQDNQRALIVGEESFGKGLIQTVYRLREGTGLMLTTAIYQTPAGRSIQRSYFEGGFYYYLLSRRDLLPSRQSSRTGRRTATESTENGGIQPDLVVRIEPENVRLRDACFEFARQLTAGQFTEPGVWQGRRNDNGRRPRDNEFQLNGGVLRRFRRYILDHPEWQISESMVDRNLDYIERRIRAELISTDQGIKIAEQFLLETDPQVLGAIGRLKEWNRGKVDDR
ncbi:MAG: S41 family peptidase [Blastocatellia bacterium]